MICPKCHSENPVGFRFCGACGQPLGEAGASVILTEPESERRQVTVLFTDLTGYTAMCELLDPEDVKEVMNRIFGEIAQVVAKYEGIIEKFVGDAAMVLFGAPKAHEDDPVRAIKAAMEIHGLVEALSPQVEARGCKPMSMHSGINTGLVVTGGADAGKGIIGVTGDTINLASRLSGMGKAGEILVGPYTYRQAEGYFDFEALEPTPVEGKAEPVRIYKVHSRKDQPSKVHRLTGLRAELIGRKAEMFQLREAIEKLREGKGSIIGICGDAGTGKSRLVEEFKATLDPREIQWREGHSNAYSQNVPYFPVTDLLRRALSIEEGDSPAKIREKVASRIELLTGKREDLIPYIGSLFGMSYPELEGTSPDSWKFLLHKAVQELLSALVKRAPTVICLEDIHWADPSSIELFRILLSEGRYPALFLCMYRPPFVLFPDPLLGDMGDSYREIRLQDLSPSDALELTGSLLKTGDVPLELRRFVREKAEGNPFYLEEVINTLIESETLVRDDGSWKFARPFRESDIPPTVHGVILARIDRLDKSTKRLLQEASAIGRNFSHEILKMITEVNEGLESCLDKLAMADILRKDSSGMGIEFIFKHALTRDAVYNGLLKKDRQEIHERIAIVIERLFSDRLPEFQETLAFHFQRGISFYKAVEYLVKSGEKSINRYAVEECDQYFQEGFNLLSGKADKTWEDKELLIDLINKWVMAYYYKGDFTGYVRLMSEHEDLCISMADKARKGLFYALFGEGLRLGGEHKKAQYYLQKGLRFAEEVGDSRAIGYTCQTLAWNCADMGLLDEALVYADRGIEISRMFPSDHYMFIKPMGAKAYAFYTRGEAKKALEVGRELLEFSRRFSNVRGIVQGHWSMGFGYWADGDLRKSIESHEMAVKNAADPFFAQFPLATLCWVYLANKQIKEAEEVTRKLMAFSQKYGFGNVGAVGRNANALLMFAKGQRMSQCMSIIQNTRQQWLQNGRMSTYVISDLILGSAYLEMVLKSSPVSISVVMKNLGFLIMNVPIAARKAEAYFNRAIELSGKIGAKGVMARSYLDLGRLHKAKGENAKARECLAHAIELFEQGEATTYLKQAREVLSSLE